MGDWTATDRKIKTPNGFIHYGGPCRDHYANFEHFKMQDESPGILTLQRPAMKAYKEACETYGKRTRRPSGFREIRVTPGTNRTCATQTALYKSDSSRYADPRYTGHTRGLAIDVDTSQGNLDIINRALQAAGWHRARSDEPWHWSYGVTI